MLHAALPLRLGNRSAACCRVQFFRSFILSKCDYASAAYTPFLSSYQDQRLNSLFKRAPRSVCRAAPRTHTAPLLERMNAHTLSIYAHMHILIFIWRCLNRCSSTLFASLVPLSEHEEGAANYSSFLCPPLHSQLSALAMLELSCGTSSQTQHASKESAPLSNC